ncbi:NAD(P)H dehydrogenase [Copromyces sp. CBS 386.78]|nr:NAD(P)H dehydrogenase [Copromyces sp. CBS 386.78]
MASTEAPAPASTTTSIVILGGNLAGLGVLHTLARHTIPALQRLSSQQQTSSTSPQQHEYQITLITPNTHFFFKPASPRALIQPLLLPGGDDSKVFPSLQDATQQYGDLVKVIPAYAYAIDRASRLVHIRRLVNTPSPAESPESNTIPYDVLVIATGTKGRSALWSMPGPGSEGLNGAEEATRREWEGVRARLKNLQGGGAHKHHDILIAGGGPVGVETTGEVASWLKAEGKTEGVTVTLVSGADKLLKRNANDGLGSKAEAYMKKQFGALVEVVHGVKVVDVQVSDSVSGGHVSGQGQHEGEGAGERGQETTTTTTVHLSDGTTRTNVALYIDATGGRGTADAFLPPSWLDASSRVITKDGYFRVRGAGSSESENDPEASGVYVAGDIVSGSDNTLIETNFQVPVVCSSIGSDLAARILSSSSPASSTSTSTSTVPNNNKIKLPGPLKQKRFKNKMAGTLLVPIGPGGGVGQILGWGVPSFLVKVAKAKGFLVDMAEPAVTGQQWK